MSGVPPVQPLACLLPGADETSFLESAKCLSLLQSTAFPMVLNAWEAGEMPEGYLLLSATAELASHTPA